MTIKTESSTRLPRYPWWAIGIVTIWLILVAAGKVVSLLHDAPIPTCIFKRITGHPCPTCGLTRAVEAMIHIKPVDAWLFNPFFFSLGLIWIAGLLFRMVAGRRIIVILNRREKYLVVSILMATFLWNWYYLIRFIG